uniref:Uncharacterized protein n=1 Tax=Meleagris gallopavo TaxID=9103 RepID=A0A803XZS6_MELGA
MLVRCCTSTSSRCSSSSCPAHQPPPPAHTALTQHSSAGGGTARGPAGPQSPPAPNCARLQCSDPTLDCGGAMLGRAHCVGMSHVETRSHTRTQPRHTCAHPRHTHHSLPTVSVYYSVLQEQGRP